MTLRAAVVMDYQNVHLGGHGVFRGKDQPLHESLLDPGSFANQLVAKRNSLQPSDDTFITLGQVDVYRGLPDSEFDANSNARNLAQKAKWEQHPKVRVVHRPLKYTFQRDENGDRLRNFEGRLVPTGHKEEKGIDVLCALAVVRYALSGLFDVVILASSDSDLTPALDEAARQGKAKVETCNWFDKNQKRTFGAHKTERRIWNTRMDEMNFERSIDRATY